MEGVSILCMQKSFDLSKGAVINVMHSVFLGIVSKQLIKYWFDVGYCSSPYYSFRRKVL